MARYLLDSNAFLNFKNNPATLRAQAREAIENPGNNLFVSLASLWEMAVKAANGKLPFYARLIAAGQEGLVRSLEESRFELLTISMRDALAASALPQHHRDPFDRMMIAQAMEESLIVITSDRIFTRYSEIRVLAA